MTEAYGGLDVRVSPIVLSLRCRIRFLEEQLQQARETCAMLQSHAIQEATRRRYRRSKRRKLEEGGAPSSQDPTGVTTAAATDVHKRSKLPPVPNAE